MSETIHFLKLHRRGYDPREEFDRAWGEKEKKLDAALSATATDLIEQQAAVEKQILKPLRSMEKFDVKEETHQEERLAITTKKAKEVQAGQRQLQGILERDRVELKKREAEIRRLNPELAQLRSLLKKVPHPLEGPVLMGGDLACQWKSNMGGKNK